MSAPIGNVDYLLPFCETETQARKVAAVKKAGSVDGAAKLLGMNLRNLQRDIAKLKARAAEKGVDPSVGLDRPVAANEKLKGRSQLVNEQTGETVLTWYKTSAEAQALQSLVEALENYSPTPLKPIPAPKRTDADLCTLYTLTDYHLGMYAWAAETGDDWDSEIASRVLVKAITEMLAKSPASAVGVLNLQGDFLHWDGLESVTPTNKHVLDADTRFDRMIDLAMDLTAFCIEQILKKHKHAHVIICEGNHDEAGSAWLRKHIKKLFAKNNRVDVDDTPFPYYAYLHGETMLGFHHGHKKKNKDLPALFSCEPRYREMWGKASYTYIHTGHYHMTEQDMSEYGGAIVERHPTLSARDAYAARGGWVSRRAARAITYHKVDGEVERITVLPR